MTPSPTATPIPTATPTPTATATPTHLRVPQISVEASPTDVKEGEDATFTFIASPAYHAQITAHYSTSGKATLGTDYILSGTPGQIIIPEGQTSSTITLHSMDDHCVKVLDKVATITLPRGVGYKISKRQTHASVMIRGLNRSR